MRKLLIISFLFAGITAFGQGYNNEWIDYSKTYYKFKIAQTGLYRINQSALPAAFAGIPHEQLQLWRNGKQVPLYIIPPVGPVGFIVEFWGQKNDGVPDKALYLNPAYQLSDKLSLETDTAAFFLTVHSVTGQNLRFTAQPNDVASNVLPAATYFMHTARNDFKQMINRGYAQNLGVNVYSSAYDEGEWWSSYEFKTEILPAPPIAGEPAQPLNYTFTGLKPYTAGPTASMRMSVSTTAALVPTRTITATFNSNTIFANSMNGIATSVMSGSVTTSTMTDNSQVTLTSNYLTSERADRAVVGFMELTYPRTWDFNNQQSFEFALPASPQMYIEITNFNAGSPTVAPVLYDLTNNRRYVADIAVAGKYRFVLPADGARNFVLVSQAVGITNLTQFQSKTFVNYAITSLQGDYLIITHNSLRAAGDPVAQYAGYRSSANGGGYNAKIYDVDELTDQFAFGIRKHPLSIKNFLRYARATFTAPPKMVYLIGRGVTYDEYYHQQGTPDGEKLNLVPTFGYPGSDILLVADAMVPVPATPVGRLAAITPQEVADYLAKITLYETVQRSPVQTIAGKEWMKNVIHVAGGANTGEDASLSAKLNNYKTVIQDTFYGGRVYTFNKTTTGPSTVITDALLSSLFKNGIGMLTYFGHGSSNNLAYNLPALSSWDNQGKYALFLMLGCNVGNFFSYDASRLTNMQTLSEKYVLSPDIGSIGLIAGTHFGTEGELDHFASRLYNAIGRTRYNQPVAVAMQETAQLVTTVPSLNYFLMRLHLEQHLLHGDPALKPYSFAKPDYAIEESQVYITPSFVSVADTAISVKAYFNNLGKAVGHASASKVSVEVKRRYPDGTTAVVFTGDIQPAIRNRDSLSFTLPIVPTRDKGENRLIITIDPLDQYSELSETNNTTEKVFFVFEDEIRPVYPYNFAIINRNNAKLVASTADPVLSPRNYVMEMDTTEFFNSPFKIVKNLNSPGGLLEFDPGIVYQDSMVYYWRVAIIPSSGAPHWNTASFMYLNGANKGFGQSHFYQHAKSSQERMYIDSADRRWKFRPGSSLITVTNSVWQHSGFGDSDFEVDINGVAIAKSNCVGHSINFSLIDAQTMKPYYNQTVPGLNPAGTPGGFMGSGSSAVCTANDRKFSFEFSYMDTVGRRKIRDFLDWVPNNVIVVARLTLDQPFNLNPYVDEWKNDALVYGAGNTMYDRFRTAGFADLDSFTFPRTWAFVYKKNAADFTPTWRFSAGLYDKIDRWNVTVTATDTLGYVTSPKFGPAAAWQEVKWRGASLENPSNDEVTVNVVGVRANGQEDVLYVLNSTQQDFNISSVNATTYPFIRLRMFAQDKIDLTPYQLRWWRLYYTPVPEGGLAANLKFNFKDTLEAGELLNFAIPFKNVSDVAFTGPIKVNVTVRDRNNQQTQIIVPRLKAVVPGDTAMLTYQLPTSALSGTNTLFVDVNPDNDQPEQYHFNNFLYRNFVVKGDVYKPTLDVTFDGVRILNGDIVSAKPAIMIKLKDESKFLPLDDTALVTLTLRYPDNTVRRFKFGTDTLKFTPPAPGGDNVATVDFTPMLPLDGEYELIVTAKDKSGNPAGDMEYRVLFQVYNTPMISNMFNYPNPFTTSTAFVFTLTGTVVPQNLKIQVLTITGKVVREITKDELGDLHIGRNITDFKWDGTDQYGQKLANGVYLYRVVTNLNGNSLDKFPTTENGAKVNTDKYFNKGYGKMYLMR